MSHRHNRANALDWRAEALEEASTYTVAAEEPAVVLQEPVEKDQPT